MLSVHYGPFQPALESAFLERLRALRAESPLGPVAVVAPSRRLADRLQRLAAVEAGLPLLGVEFHTFQSLAVAILDDAGWPEETLLSDPVFHNRLIDQLLADVPGLGGALRPRALAAAVRSSLRDLLDAGVSPRQVSEHFGRELLADPAEQTRLSGLLSLVDAYLTRLKRRKLLAPAALPRLAAAAAAASGLLAGYRELLYYGFYDLTGRQLDFFEAVVSRCPARLYFPYRKGHPAFRFAEQFFEEKLLRYPTVELPARGSGALGAALDGLFVPESVPAAGANLRLISASGARDEAWAVAKEIVGLAEAGVDYGDIGVVARSLDPYRVALSEAFADNEIPFDMGADEPLLRQPVAKHLYNLLALPRRDFSAAVVEELLCSPYFAGRPPVRRLRLWRDAIERLGIVGGWLQWRKLEGRLGDDLPLGVDADEGGPGRVVPREELRALWELVSRWRAALTEPASDWAGLAARAEALVKEALALPPDATPRELQAWESSLRLIRELARLDLLGMAPTWDAFVDALEEKLRGAKLEAEPGSGVRVRDAMDARGESFGTLFMLGLNEKSFPRAVSEDPLLREPARAALKHPAGYWIARKSAGHEEERLLFYITCASARERLVCLFQRSDQAGKAAVPSLYLRELCRAAGLDFAEVPERVAREPLRRLRDVPPERLSPREAALLAACGRADAGRYLEAGGLDGELTSSSLAVLPELGAFGAPGSFDGIIGRPDEYLARLRADGLSPSALDRLAECPFRFFSERLLGLSSPEDGAEKGDFAARTRGRIYHEILERYHGSPGVRLEEAVEAVFGAYGWRELGLYPLLWQAAKQTMTERLRDFVEWDEAGRPPFRPRWLEKELSAPLPLPLPPALEGLRLKGFVDRVDVSEDGRSFRVIDYKTRRRDEGKLITVIGRGKLNQLPVYAELVGGAMPEASFESARLLNIEASPDRPREQVLSGAEWAAGREAYFSALSGRIEEIAAGRFPIRPNDGEHGHCGHCGFATACRKSHGPSRARAAAAAPELRAASAPPPKRAVKGRKK